MRSRISSGLAFLLCLCCAGAQQSAAPAADSTSDTASAPLVIHYSGADVTEPELLPFSNSITPPQRCKKYDGTATVLVVVDRQGSPRDFYFIHPTGTDLDRLALKIVGIDRLKPGTAQGAPAAVAVADEIKLHACIEEQKDQNGRKTYGLTLRSMPEQSLSTQSGPLVSPLPRQTSAPHRNPEPVPPGTYRVGGPVSAPWALNMVEARYSGKGRREGISGVCIITLIVDKHGMPEGLKLKSGLEPTMDENAMEAVRQYRFVPAMLNGEPVPVAITVEVNFRLYTGFH